MKCMLGTMSFQIKIALKSASIILLFLFVAAAVPANAKTVSVRGHVTKSGKYIAPSHRTSPDHSKLNNWSSKGNLNPYTGKAGTKKLY